MTRRWAVLALGLWAGCSDGGGSSGSAGSAAPRTAEPAAWRSADVGAVGQAGAFTATGATFLLAGGGADIWNAADAFRFAWLPLSGDGQIVARVARLDPTDAWAKAGVMIRASLDPASPFAMAVVTPSHGTSLQWRAAAGGGCDLAFGPGSAAPVWLRLSRMGDLFTGAASADGRSWTVIASRTVPMGTDVLIGLCVTAHDDAKRAETEIDGVALALPRIEASLSDGFWAPRIATNRTASVPQLVQQVTADQTIENFPKAAGLQGGNHAGFPWADGDVYRVVGAVAAAHRGHANPYEYWMEQRIAHIAAAQRPDGYLNTYFQLGNAGRGAGGTTLTTQPWEDLIGAHEDAILGSLIEGALQHYRATGRASFLDVARRAADHVASIFGEGRRSGVPGHQEIELALLKLRREPGKGTAADLDLAAFYLDERGRHSGGRRIYGEYCQDLRPIRQEAEPLGHCVRGTYQWAAAAELAAATGEPALKEALARVFWNVVDRKMYVTGGFGHALYNEGFGPDFDLSPEQAYNETCAACGMIFWAWRMALLTGDARCSDVLERVLYNTFAAARSLDGTRLYYNNSMARRGNRSRFGIPCCATNLVRTMPTIPDYQYSAGPDGLRAHLYIAGEARVPWEGRTVGLRQATAYPWQGRVTLTVEVAQPTAFPLHLRIPGWAEGATASVNGAPVAAAPGWLSIAPTWSGGDTGELDLPMPVRRIAPPAQAWAGRGRTALARGPLVYCLESADNPIDVHRIVLPPGASLAPEHDAGFLGGVTRLRGQGTNADGGGPVAVTMIPYAVWDNRAHDTGMTVMVPESASAANAEVERDRGRLADATITASHGGATGAVADGILPRNSEDGAIARFTWWDHAGTEEWIACEFPSPRRIRRSDLFWFNDAGQGGGCDFPETFRHEYWTGAAWAPLVLDADYMSAVDLYAPWHFTIVRFAPVTTTKVRLVAKLKPGKSAGLLEWRLPDAE
jgi:DUF1680 family protein